MRTYADSDNENAKVKQTLENLLFQFLKDLSGKRLKVLCSNIVKRFAREKWNERLVSLSFLQRKAEVRRKQKVREAFKHWKFVGVDFDKLKLQEKIEEQKRKSDSKLKRLTTPKANKNMDLGYEECTFQPKFISSKSTRIKATKAKKEKATKSVFLVEEKTKKRSCDYEQLTKLHKTYEEVRWKKQIKQQEIDEVKE